MADVDEQRLPQVAQVQAERANAVAYGDDVRVKALDRRLADLGVRQQAAERRQAAAEDEPTAKRSAPAGRSVRPRQQG